MAAPRKRPSFETPGSAGLLRMRAEVRRHFPIGASHQLGVDMENPTFMRRGSTAIRHVVVAKPTASLHQAEFKLGLF
jgi:hypothetical protein